MKSELNWFEITLCDGLKFGYACVNVDVIADCVRMSEMRASLHLQNEFKPKNAAVRYWQGVSNMFDITCMKRIILSITFAQELSINFGFLLTKER